jgi:hypothetical protein
MRRFQSLAAAAAISVIACAGCDDQKNLHRTSWQNSSQTTLISRVLTSASCEPAKVPVVGFQASTVYPGSGAGPEYTIIFEKAKAVLNELVAADWSMTDGYAFISAGMSPPPPASSASKAVSWKWRVIVTRTYIIGVEGRRAYVNVSIDPATQLEHVQIQARGAATDPNKLGGVTVSLRSSPSTKYVQFSDDQYVELIEDAAAPTPGSPPASGEFFEAVKRLNAAALCLNLAFPDTATPEPTSSSTEPGGTSK